MLDKITAFTESNRGSLTVFAAVAPFVLSLIFLITLAHGNVQIVSYLVSRMGLVDVWIVGVLGLLIAFMQVAVLMCLLYIFENHRKLEDWKLWSTSVLTSLACSVIPVSFIIGAIVGGIVRMIVLRYDRSKKTTHLEKTQKSARALMIYMAIISLAISITSYPQLPQTLYNLDEKQVNGKEISHDDKTTLILEQESNQLILLANSEIKHQALCITASNNWSSQTIYELLVNKKRVKICN